jgi:beta-mannosidase
VLHDGKLEYVVTRLYALAILFSICISTARGATQEPREASSNSVINSRVYDVLPVATRGDEELSLDGQWDIAQASGDFDPKAGNLQGLQWKQVRMPGTIQYALFQAGDIENPWFSDNWKRLQWIQDNDWYLRRSFQTPAGWRRRHIRLRFDGMDYTGAVWLDGKFLGIHEGMFGGPTFDVSEAALPGQVHELVVRLIHEASTTPTQSMTPQLGIKVMKSWAIDGRSYVWGNRYRSIGLWRSVRLVSSGQAYMEAPWVRTDRLDPHAATLWAQSTIVNTGSPFNGTVQASIVDLPTGKVVWQQNAVQLVPTGSSYWERTVRLQNPKLWWPVGMGDQHLYRLQLLLSRDRTKEDSINQRFGIRTLEMRRNPYLPSKPRANPEVPSWLTDQTKLADRHTDHLWQRGDLWQADNLLEEDAEYNSDEGARYLFVVNGRPVYAKGVNWLTSDELLALTPQRENWLVKAAALGGINLFRLNGGVDIFESEQFFNLCDEAGILVWQELPLNWSHDSGVSLTTWREQIKQSVLRLRQHPSMAVYVGGNEFNPYLEAMAPYLGIGREIVAEYDDRPFRMASPMGTDFHAYASQEADFNALWNGDPNWYIRDFSENANFISEWSFAVLPDIDTLKRVAPPSELSHEPVGFDMEKFAAARPAIQEHLAELGDTPMVQRKSSWYGDMAKADLTQYAEYSQMAQADILGYVFEQWRAQFPYKGGQAVWTYNPISPSSGWNLIDWFGQPQMSYYSTKRADEPVHVMANTNFFSWGPGSTFHASVFAVNEGVKNLSGAKITARILDRQMTPVFTEQWQQTIPAGGAKSENRALSWRIPSDTPESYFFLEVTLSTADGHRISRRAYWLRILNSLKDPEALGKWQSKASAEIMSTNGPWLKPQIEGLGTNLSARIVRSDVEGPELHLSVLVRNSGNKPAYPVKLAVEPSTYSALWTDNYFWLAPGESTTIEGTVRLDMSGLDPITNPRVAAPSDLKLSVSAWNAAPSTLQPQSIHSKTR